MKKTIKRSLSIILAISIIFGSAAVGLGEIVFKGIDFNGIFAIKAKAASSGTCGDNLTWTFDDESTLTIIGTGDMYDYTLQTCPWYGFSSSISTVIINEGVTSIGTSAFNSCIMLNTITFPESLISIGDYALGYCYNLTTITTPLSENITSIGDDAFIYCTSLTDINVSENNSYYSSIDGVLFNKDKTHLIQYPAGKINTSYTIPDGVISVGNKAFYYSDVTSITIPDSVISIGEESFRNCSKLTTVTIGDGTTDDNTYIAGTAN